MTDFEQAVKSAAEKAVLRIISEGGWVMPDYNNRFKIPAEFVAGIWQMIDSEKLKKLLSDRLEAELADRIMNHMAAEIATDVKQILSVKDRREALRHYARECMDAVMSAGDKQ